MKKILLTTISLLLVSCASKPSSQITIKKDHCKPFVLKNNEFKKITNYEEAYQAQKNLFILLDYNLKEAERCHECWKETFNSLNK